MGARCKRQKCRVHRDAREGAEAKRAHLVRAPRFSQAAPSLYPSKKALSRPHWSALQRIAYPEAEAGKILGTPLPAASSKTSASSSFSSKERMNIR